MGEVEGKSAQRDESNLNQLLAPLAALQSLLDAYKNQGVIIGGIAASLLGVPRYTADLDAVFLLRVSELSGFLELAEKYSIEARFPDMEAFARKNRVLLLRHSTSGINIDISLGFLPFEVEMVERSQNREIGGIVLRLPTPEDLIIMKAVAHRPKDLSDIQMIAANYPKLDKQRILDWVKQFAEALDFPELIEMIRKLL